MFNLYPYKNLNDLNLDYILKTLKQLKETVETFIATETVTFADPILWNISSQYAKNTIVLSNSGDAYLSKQTVPVNIQLDNSDYWQEIFNFADYVRTANSNLTFNIEQGTTRATHAYAVDAWLLWDDVLYKVTSAIAIDDLLIVGTNIVHFTVEDFIKAFMTNANALIQQYKNDIDASELAYRQQLAQDIANTTATLQAQLNLAISGATVDSEVINARLGANGITYNTLGDAIRGQITDLNNATVKKVGWKEVNEMNTTFFTMGSNRYNKDTATDGVMINQTDSGTHADASFTTSDYIYVGDLSTIKFMRLNAYGTAVMSDSAYYMLFDADFNKLANRSVGNSADVSSATWIKISNTLDYKSSFMLLDNATTATEYIPYTFTFKYTEDIYNELALKASKSELNAGLALKVDKIGTGQVDEKNTTFFTQSLNIFDYHSVTDGVQLNQDSDGTHAQSGYSTSDYIYVADLNGVDFYTDDHVGGVIAATAQFVLYDINKNRLSNRGQATSADVSSAVYIRISFATSDKMYLMVADSDETIISYESYGFLFDYADDKIEINPTDSNILQILMANKGKNVYFNSGDYDIIQIYKDHYGNDFFDNYAGYSLDYLCRGIPVYQGTTMKFSPDARFTCNYDGNNIYVRMNFSAFAFEGGVTFDGLNIEASGIRNIIHDDFDNNYVGKTIIKNCHFKHDSIIIAGGLALHELVEIYNNYFERTDTTQQIFDFSYHQNGTSGAQSKMIIKDNYCSKGISIRYYGTSTLITDCLISNNSVANDIELKAETESSTVQNMRVLKWNNEIRNP